MFTFTCLTSRFLTVMRSVRFRNTDVLNWLHDSYVIHVVELQLRSQEWSLLLVLPALSLSLFLSLSPSSLFPLHLVGIVSKYAHAFIVTEWSDCNKVITSHLSVRCLLIFCVTESNDIKFYLPKNEWPQKSQFFFFLCMIALIFITLSLLICLDPYVHAVLPQF